MPTLISQSKRAFPLAKKNSPGERGTNSGVIPLAAANRTTHDIDVAAPEFRSPRRGTSRTTVTSGFRRSEQTARRSAVRTDRRVKAFAAADAAIALADSELVTKLMNRKIEFISDPVLASLPLNKVVAHVDSLPSVTAGNGPLPKAPTGLPAYLASLYETPLLTKDVELSLFLRMNALKQAACQFRDALRTAHPVRTHAEFAERLLDDALRIRNQIMQANLRLVVSIAKKFADPINGFDELVSEGNMPLMRAVELFDARRGFRFSTYATWAIRNHLRRFVSDRNKFRKRFVTVDDELQDRDCQESVGIGEGEQRFRMQQTMLTRVFQELPDREQYIVESRFGLNDVREARTLAEIGKHLGISKERVRQLAMVAVEKLRKLTGSDLEELVAI